MLLKVHSEMVKIRKTLCAATLVAATLVACTKKSAVPLESVPVRSLKQDPAGISFSWDQLGPVTNPLSRQSATVESGTPLNILGWALSSHRTKLVSEVDLMMDDGLYQIPYGQPRPDVAQIYGNPGVTNCGFAASFPARDLGAGKHKIALRIIGADRKSYLQSPGVIVTVR